MKFRWLIVLSASVTVLACGGSSPTGPSAPPVAVALEGGGDAVVALGLANEPPLLVLRTRPRAVPGDPYPVVSGVAPLSVHFNLCSSSDPDQIPGDPDRGDTITWQFHFGDDGTQALHPDGTFNPHFEHFCRTDHTYAEPGRYTVTVSVTDKHLEDQGHDVAASARTTRRLTVEVRSGGDAPAATPTPTPAPPCAGGPCTVFATSTVSTGNLGGLAGADARCQSLASAAGLAGTYQAWLSDATVGPATRFRNRSSTPYQRVDGTRIAADWADLTDGVLAARIALDESGASVSGAVWTNTDVDGTPRSSSPPCANWTSTSSGPIALFGSTGDLGAGWTHVGGGPCTALRRLYCFQQ